jgi:hypothetical protein
MNYMTIRYANYIILYLSIAILLNPIRLLDIFNTAILVVILSLLVSFIIAGQFFLSRWGRGLNPLEYFIGFFPLLLIPLAVFNNHPLNYIITDAIKPIAWIGIVGFFKTAEINQEYFLYRIRKSIYIISFCSAFSVFVVFGLIMSGTTLRASAGDIAMLFPLIYFFFTGRGFISLALFFVVILGAKVGPLVSLIAVFIIYFGTSLRLRSLIFFIVTVFSLMIIFLTFDYESWSEFIPVIGKFDIFFNQAFSFANLETIDRFLLGGRLSEVIASIIVYSEQPELLLTGPGPGYVYEIYINGALEPDHHGVHFSPVSIFTIYGGIYFLIFYAYMLFLSFQSIICLKNRNSSLKMIAAAFFLGNLINSFTAFSIFSLLLFPMAIGLLQNKSFSLNRVVKE